MYLKSNKCNHRLRVIAIDQQSYQDTTKGKRKVYYNR